jgi:hypothetical protein
MSLHFPEPPPDFRSALRKGLLEVSANYRNHEYNHPMGGEFEPDRTEMPHEVFSISLSSLKLGAGVTNAIGEGWRVFLEQEPPARVAEVTLGPDSEHLLFLGTSTGPQIDYTKSLLYTLSSDGDLTSGSFTVRLLRVKPLYLACIWLSTDAPAKDLFIPLPPSFVPFIQGKRFKAEEFDELLRTAASTQAPNVTTLFAK